MKKSEITTLKNALSELPDIINSIKKPFGELHRVVRAIQGVTDDYEDELDEDTLLFLEAAEDVLTNFHKMHKAHSGMEDELEALCKPETKKSVKETPLGTHAAADFAARVKATMATIPPNDAPAGGWGERKVFIFAIRERMKMEKEAFKIEILKAFQEGKLVLTRFDIPMAAGEAVRKRTEADEINDRGASYHLVGRP